jgi:hypothetical protein
MSGLSRQSARLPLFYWSSLPPYTVFDLLLVLWFSFDENLMVPDTDLSSLPSPTSTNSAEVAAHPRKASQKLKEVYASWAVDQSEF